MQITNLPFDIMYIIINFNFLEEYLNLIYISKDVYQCFKNNYILSNLIKNNGISIIINSYSYNFKKNNNTLSITKNNNNLFKIVYFLKNDLIHF